MKKLILILLHVGFWELLYPQTSSEEGNIEHSIKEVFDNVSNATSIQLDYRIGFAADQSGSYSYTYVTFYRNLTCSKAITEIYDTYISDSIYFKAIKKDKEILYLKSSPKNLKQFETLGGDVQFNPLKKSGFEVDKGSSNLDKNIIVLNGSIANGIDKAYIHIDKEQLVPISLEYIYTNGSRFKIEFEKILINQNLNWDCDKGDFFDLINNELIVSPKYSNYKLIKL